MKKNYPDMSAVIRAKIIPGLVAPKKAWVWGNKKEREEKENNNAYYEAAVDQNAFFNDQEEHEEDNADTTA